MERCAREPQRRDTGTLAANRDAQRTREVIIAMKLSGSDRSYTVKKKASNHEWVLFDVEEWQSGRRSRRLTAQLTATAATRPSVEQDIATWCERNPAELPQDGGTFKPDLDTVQRLVDRR